MANLKDLLYGYEEGSTTTPGEFLLENTQTWVSQNGGCAYVWTVPAGRSKMVFEMWSGGSSGGRSCCCMQGKGGYPGGYAKFFANITPGQQVCFCSAGTSNTSNGNICGTCGCSSMACVSGQWCVCIEGGHCMDRMHCFSAGNCYSCCATCTCCGGCSYESGSITRLQTYSNSTGLQQSNQFCYEYGFQYMGSGYGLPGLRPQGTSTCCQSCHGGVCGNYSSCCGQACYHQAYHPAGGGQSAWAMGGECRCGSPGGGGMIYVVYW